MFFASTPVWQMSADLVCVRALHACVSHSGTKRRAGSFRFASCGLGPVWRWPRSLVGNSKSVMVSAQGVAENGTCGGLAKATLTSYVVISTLAGHQAASPSLNAQARVQTPPTSTIEPRDAHPRAWVQMRPYQRKDSFMNKGTVKVYNDQKASASFNRMMAARTCSSTPPRSSAPGCVA